MRFRNTKSGVIVDVPSELRGNWERIDGGKPKTVVPVSIPEPVEDEADVKSAKKTRTTRKKK